MVATGTQKRDNDAELKEMAKTTVPDILKSSKKEEKHQ